MELETAGPRRRDVFDSDVTGPEDTGRGAYRVSPLSLSKKDLDGRRGTGLSGGKLIVGGAAVQKCSLLPYFDPRYRTLIKR